MIRFPPFKANYLIDVNPIKPSLTFPTVFPFPFLLTLQAGVNYEKLSSKWIVSPQKHIFVLFWIFNFLQNWSDKLLNKRGEGIFKIRGLEEKKTCGKIIWFLSYIAAVVHCCPWLTIHITLLVRFIFFVRSERVTSYCHRNW